MSPTDTLILFGGAVTTALCGAVGYLFKAFEHAKALIEKELRECQSDRVNLWKEIAKLEAKVSKNTDELKHERRDRE